MGTTGDAIRGRVAENMFSEFLIENETEAYNFFINANVDENEELSCSVLSEKYGYVLKERCDEQKIKDVREAMYSNFIELAKGVRDAKLV